MPGAGTDSSDPMARANAFADGSNISKGADGPTREQLVVDYMKQHPGDFYTPVTSGSR